ncbi:hypothetical protein [Xanthocytophaga agilis]|uniref:Uncharacterized protein n=1 Tax=Xanthocytophaga agilis TaxID=3048010 RepID=A0AAE3R028_9BACT|nr:hypothetical protein [Xanthocytophaga agilis]MDJ1501201.1 hypothetical protein [Xanthocytophaga agilis]
MRKLALVILFLVTSIRAKAQWACDDIMTLVNTKWILNTYKRVDDSVKLKAPDPQYMIAFCEKGCIEFYVDGVVIGTGYYKRNKRRCYDIEPGKAVRRYTPGWAAKKPKLFDTYFSHFYSDMISAFILLIRDKTIELHFSNDPGDWGWLRFKRVLL